MKKLLIIIVLFVILYGIIMVVPAYFAKDSPISLTPTIKNLKSATKESSEITTTATTNKFCIVSDTNGELLNFRKGASLDAEIITGIYEGTTLEILEDKDDWYNVMWNDVKGWVNKNYCK